MLRSVVIGMVLLALPGLAAERSSRARVSAKGTYSVRMVVRGPEQCTLEVSKESGIEWKLERCVGGVDDLYFVSDDGAKVWILYPLAPKGTQKLPGKRNKKLPAWANTVVAAEYDRNGARVEERRLLDFVSRQALPEVRQMSQHIKWLEGLLGVPGKGPRLTDAGRIDFETVGGGKTHQLTF
ncbi:hypothetical protein [Melittangium boletus]|uniref:Lipoprotein n=1 Tax=Melittangium boletus DSM 14713 TaxID=1294270 RepID=A0A250ID94_9BACT|nr:hypothetical protein [Melittangium boletus]ATB29180.1 hypothetical protein MEBOL_002629 [Melittangium boletus DSM 14713]